MRRLAQMVAGLLLCLLAGHPLAAALMTGATQERACCGKGKGAHACCKRKAAENSGASLTTASRCGSDCCCQHVLFTEKPFEAWTVARTGWPVGAATVKGVEGTIELSTGLDRTRWQRPPPAHSWF